MNLSENGFAILGVSPTDDREMLITKADEAMLLTGKNGEDALNKLMQLNRRIVDEISWFPGTPSTVAFEFLEYSRKIAAGEIVAVPDIERLGTPLAQANALKSFFDLWPAGDPELLIGLCRSLDMIISKITVEETWQAINADREAGGWEVIRNAGDITDPLNEHLRKLCEPIIKAAEGMDQESFSRVICHLSRCQSIDLYGDVLHELRQAYEIRYHEREEQLKNRIKAQLKHQPKVLRILTVNSHFEKIKKTITKWYQLILPLQFVHGSAREETEDMVLAFIKHLTDFINTSPAEIKYETIKKGFRQKSIMYSTKQKSIAKASEIVEWAERLFSTGGNEGLIKSFRLFEGELRRLKKDEAAKLAQAKSEAEQRFW